jgi:hypothetical protein
MANLSFENPAVASLSIRLHFVVSAAKHMEAELRSFANSIWSRNLKIPQQVRCALSGTLPE